MIKLCKEIVIFLFFAKILENFGVSEKYGKFVKLIISLIVVLKLITPVFALFNGDFNFPEIALDIENELVFETEEIKKVEAVEKSEIEIKVEDAAWKK